MTYLDSPEGCGPLAAQIVEAYLNNDSPTFHALITHATEEFDAGYVIVALVSSIAALIKTASVWGVHPDDLRHAITEGLQEETP